MTQTKASTQLLACPFCGSKAELIFDFVYWVRCTNKKCRVRLPDKYEAEMAIEQWNKKSG